MGRSSRTKVIVRRKQHTIPKITNSSCNHNATNHTCSQGHAQQNKSTPSEGERPSLDLEREKTMARGKKGFWSSLVTYHSVSSSGSKSAQQNDVGITKLDVCKKQVSSKKPSGGRCVVCRAYTQRVCASCHKVPYCGEEHQKRHKIDHEKECYPAEAITESNGTTIIDGPLGQGPFMRATKDVNFMDVIYVDRPLMTGPGCCFGASYEPFCLGCTEAVKPGQTCSRCSWPLCGPICGKNTLHEKYECDIFRKNKVLELRDPYQYELVRVLRCLLARDKDPNTFAALMKLEGATSHRTYVECLREATKTASLFINKICNLTEFDKAIIDKMCGIVDLQTFVSGKHRSSMQIFSFPAKLVHSCNPNTRFIEILRPNGEHVLQIVAIKPIRKGELITQTLLTTFGPTFERQRFLKDQYYFVCQCDLCVDSTEAGTYFSAIKCMDCHDSGSIGKTYGYLLPKNPLIENSAWRCEMCRIEHTADDIFNLLHEKENSLWAFLNATSSKDAQTDILAVESKILEFCRIFHPNHFYVWKLQQRLVSKIVENLEYRVAPLSRQEFKMSFKRLKLLINNTMAILNQLQPACSLIRGRTLFDVVRALSAYIQWSVIFGKVESFDAHSDSKHFYYLIDETIDILEPEITSIAAAIIQELLTIRIHTNEISLRLSDQLPTIIENDYYPDDDEKAKASASEKDYSD